MLFGLLFPSRSLRCVEQELSALRVRDLSQHLVVEEDAFGYHILNNVAKIPGVIETAVRLPLPRQTDLLDSLFQAPDDRFVGYRWPNPLILTPLTQLLFELILMHLKPTLQ